MQIDDEALMALADGELSEKERERVAAAVERDPVLHARLQIFVDTRKALARLSGSSEADPRDAKLIARINAARQLQQTGDIGVTSGQGSMTVTRWFHRVGSVAANLGWRPYAAAAVAAFAVVALGWQADQTSGSHPTGLSRSIIAALEVTPSGEVALDGGLTVIASYHMDDGSFCREYQLAEPAYDAVIACRDGGEWQQKLAVVAGDDQGFSPASGAIDLVDDFLRNSGAGLPLTPEEEAAILAGF